MNNKDIHKFYKFLKGFPEHHSLMKNLLLEYLHLRDENDRLVKVNLELLEDIKQYENIVRENEEINFH